PESAVAFSGFLPRFCSTCCSIGTSCRLSLACCVIAQPTITCAVASTAACALKPCTKLLVAPSFMIRESGSVKFRWAFGSGLACSGSGTCGGRPPDFLPPLLLLFLPLFQSRFDRRFLHHRALSGFLLQRRLGLRDFL